MRFQRTQIYLDPEEHRRLLAEAAERGLSLAEHLRRVIGARTGEPAIPYDARSFDGIFDLINSGHKDTVEHMDEEVGLAFEEEFQRDTAPQAQPAARRPKRRNAK
jgi:hypothetical protein